MTATPAFAHTGEPVCAAVMALQCGEETHRVGVTVRGQAVMLDHDRRLERLAVGIDRDARTACELAYDAVRNALAGFGGPRTNPVAVSDEAVVDYVTASDGMRRRRRESSAHHDRLSGISVLAGGPPHLPKDWREVPDSVLRQTILRARQAAVERIIPQLFLQTDYPILRRHRPPGPGVRRPACWHVQANSLGPDEEFAVATRPHPDDRNRSCVSLTIPLALDWYRTIYKQGLALLEGTLVVAKARQRGRLGPIVTRLVQTGARFRLAEVEAVWSGATWRVVRADGRDGGGTGSRPSPWD